MTMESNYWNRDRDRYERRGNDERRRADEDSYRGAYRLDNTSDHRNVSTWDWGSDRERGRRENDYNRNYNQDYNRNYNQDYNTPNRDTSRNRGYDHDNYNADSRYYRDEQDSRYRSSNNSNWDEQRRSSSGGYGNDAHREHRSVHDRIESRGRGVLSNFDANYGPDNYGQGGGANYGNEAGSLSYGYDGSSNYDPDWNRHYNPLTGRLSGDRRSYHGNYTSRHPERGQGDREDRY